MDNGASSYRRFLDGEESAFDEIMTAYREGLTLFINRYVCNAAEAEDIAIDVFTYILLHKNRYNFKTSFKTYLYMLGRSRALDYLRKRRRLDTFSLEEAEGQGEPPEESVFECERKRAVNEAVSKLPREMREAVHLFYFEELSY
ncbi:MAG: sigma-70 family RNA polymerase sigma factor, partial [Clostridia bacterium]|nr:sigma-70 family RNA polymerase sigma factor [Clostridia bacterium]